MLVTAGDGQRIAPRNGAVFVIGDIDGIENFVTVVVGGGDGAILANVGKDGLGGAVAVVVVPVGAVAVTFDGVANLGEIRAGAGESGLQVVQDMSEK